MFKIALQENRQQIGVWSSLCSPVCAEILGQANFDWILFDSEHSPTEISGLLPLLQAATGGKPHLAVRVAENEEQLIKRALDIGAETIFAPFIQTAADAVELVQACRYPPAGTRGVAGAVRANGYGRDPGYVKEANEHIGIIAQVETEEALNKIGKIAAVEGIDGIFIGPSDLSASLGLPGQIEHPVIQQKLREAATAIRSAGKPAGILARNAIEARQYLEWGYLFVAAGTDMGLLVKSIDGLAGEMGI